MTALLQLSRRLKSAKRRMLSVANTDGLISSLCPVNDALGEARAEIFALRKDLGDSVLLPCQSQKSQTFAISMASSTLFEISIALGNGMSRGWP